MIEFMEKIDLLKKELDQDISIQNLKKIQEEILNDKRLYEQIKKKDFCMNQDPRIIEYKKLENQVNFLILEMNQYVKNHLFGDGVCHESD